MIGTHCHLIFLKFKTYVLEVQTVHTFISIIDINTNCFLRHFKRWLTSFKMLLKLISILNEYKM